MLNYSVAELRFVKLFLPFFRKLFRLPYRDRFYMQARQRENEEKARKPPGIERNTQPDSAARRGPKGHLRFGKAAGQIREPVSGAVLDDRMTLYLRMGKSHRQGSAAGSDKNENK